MNMTATEARANSHVCVIYINASREAVWDGLTNPEFTRQYFHQTRFESDWQPGSAMNCYMPDGSYAVRGEVLESEHPAKLSFTWHVHYNPEAKQEAPSRVTYLLESVEGATKLTVIHDEFPEGSVVLPSISEGWIAILCNLKTLLETGQAMAVS